RTQLYFIDSSRVHLKDERYEFSRPTMVFDEFNVGPDDRSAVIFYATGPGQQAWERPHEVSLFTGALLRCLDGEAASPIDNSLQRWGVTVNSMIQGLSRIMDSTTWLRDKQVPVVGGLVRDHVIRYLESPPTIDVGIRILNATTPNTLSVEDSSGELI